MTKKEKVALLVAARALLARPKGWVKGTACEYVGGKLDYAYCATGACRHIAGEWVVIGASLKTTKLIRELRLTLKDDGDKYCDVIVFNDKPATRKKDVLSLFDRTIERLSA